MITEEIKNKILQMKPFYMQNAIHGIFSWQELEHLLNFRPVVNNQRFNLNMDCEHQWPNQAWLSDVNTWPTNLLEFRLKKYSAYFSDMSKVNEKVNAICGQLEKIIGWPTDAHIYFSIVENHLETSGFSPHWDWSHNLIVQIEGTSQHKIWNKSATGEEPRYINLIEENPIIDVIMKPGDITFIPRMMYHHVISKTKRLSISFPMNPIGGLEAQDRTWIKLV